MQSLFKSFIRRSVSYLASPHGIYSRNIPSTAAFSSQTSPLGTGKQVRVRYAPSPTGSLHLGGLRTALYNYLIARKHGGKCIIRIEDTDRTRYVPGAVEQLLKDLKWVGLDFDEGPGELGGAYGPYIQSERLEIYKKYAQMLVDRGHAYHCFCTPRRLEQLRESQSQTGAPSVYDRFCLHLPREQVEEKIAKGEPYVIRMKVPHEGTTVVSDVIRGKVSFINKTVDDQVLMKSDGYPTYHLANIVDDHLMEITHVIRGEEWLPSAVKHVLLYQMFGWEAPVFAHLPLLLREDGSKLSKRFKDASLEYYIEQGFLPEALINFVALLGWHPSVEDALALKKGATSTPAPSATSSTTQSAESKPVDPAAALKAALADAKHLKAKRVVKQSTQHPQASAALPAAAAPGYGVSVGEIYTMDELSSLFQLENVQKGGAAVDFAKLTWCHNQHWKRAVTAPVPGQEAEATARLDRLTDLVLPAVEKSWKRWLDGYVLHPSLPTEVVFQRPQHKSVSVPSRKHIQAALLSTHDHPCLISEFPAKSFYVWVRPEWSHPMVWNRLVQCWIPDPELDVDSLQKKPLAVEKPPGEDNTSGKPKKKHAKESVPSRRMLQHVLEWISNERISPQPLTAERVVSNLNSISKSLSISLREVYLVLRICLSGTSAGAGVGEQITALGLDETEARIRALLQLATKSSN